MAGFEAFGSNTLDSQGGLLGKSLLESATLSTSLEDNSAFLGLLQTLNNSAGLDSFSHLNTAAPNSVGSPSTIFNSSSSLVPNASQPLISISSNSYDPLTGNSNNTPLVSPNTIGDPLTGNSSSSAATANTGNNSSNLKLSSNSVQPNSSDLNSPATSPNTTATANSLATSPNSAPPSGTLISQGKFGDFNGGNDVPLHLKDANGKVTETFSLTGDGFGEVFQDQDLNLEYVSFTGTDATTNVQISAVDNVRFGDYTGSTLNVQTSGSITAGNIALQNTNISSSPGLRLQSGLSDVQSTAAGNSYKITDLNVLLGGSEIYPYGMNNSGELVGYFVDSDGWNRPFLYSGGQMTNIGILPSYSEGYANSINSSGQVVGYSSSPHRAFLSSNGLTTDIGILPGGIFRYPSSINDSGQVVGTGDSNDGYSHAFLYSEGKIADLGTLPGYTSSGAGDINSSGQIVGASYNYSYYNGWSDRAFIYSNGQMSDLGFLPGDNISNAAAINDSGQVVGSSGLKTFGTLPGNIPSHAFLYSDGLMTDLGVLLGDFASYAADINNFGQIIGGSQNYRHDYHPFLYTGGKMNDLNSLIPRDSGWILEDASDINDKGQILGYGTINGQERAFLLDPIAGITPTPRDGINVGNISTLGGSVSLQGMEITLNGSQVTTKGGNITLDGPTILNSTTGTLTFDSTKSTDNSSGGDITLKNTLDGYSADTQSLNITAGTGSIALNKAVGSSAALKDFAVNSAKTFTASDITSDGDATITATSNIITGNILSKTGAVNLTSKTSFITTSDISTGGNVTASNSKVNITLTAADDITTANLSTHSLGKVSINLKQNTDIADQNSGDVITGGINARQIDILSDGGFTANSDLQTNEGDINITTLGDILTGKIVAKNGGVSLISGRGGILAQGEIDSDLGLAALAIQNITTNKIKSSKEAIILSSDRGAVTVSGEISGYDDISIDALSDVVAQAINSEDGGVALISHGGSVTATGSILSAENLFLAAQGNVLAQKDIKSLFDVVTLVSSQGSVTAQSAIVGGTDIAISAKLGITTQSILSRWGDAIALVAEQGSVTTSGNITTDQGEVYISSIGDVVSQNIISNGGEVNIISSQGSVTTGYLRSDWDNTGGNIYIQAAGLVRITGSIFVNKTNYSIYTGTTKKGSINIAYNSDGVKSNKSKIDFIIGDASINGTLAKTSDPPKFKTTPVKPGIPTVKPGAGWWLIIPSLLEELLKVEPAGTPDHSDEINPITGEGYYIDAGEYDLVKQLTSQQRKTLTNIINNKTLPEEERLQKQDLHRGKVDEHGCFSLELVRHLGGYKPHSDYATLVTGSNGDYLVLTPQGFYASYDGLVRTDSAIVKNKLEAPGSVAEVKTDQRWLRKYLSPSSKYYNSEPKNDYEVRQHTKMIEQVSIYSKVAEYCELKFFMSFAMRDAALAAREIFEYQQPKAVQRPVEVHYIRFP